MFLVNDDLSIYATRGDIVCLNVSATDDRTGLPYEFQPGDILQMKVYVKKDAESVVLQKDFPVPAKTNTVGVFLTEQDTKFGDVISKPTDYWYEVTLNPYTNPQTFIGYDEDGAKIFKLFPEGKDIKSDEEEVTPEDIPVVDADLSLLSSRPVENKAIARAITLVKNDIALMDSRLMGRIKANANANTETVEQIAVERARIDNLLSGATAEDSEVVDIRVGANGKTYSTAGTAVREQFLALPLPVAAIEPGDNLNLDAYTSPANYVFALTSGVYPLPDKFAEVPRYLVVECFGERIADLGNIQTWGRQTIYSVDGDKAYHRYFKYDYTTQGFAFNEWVSVNQYNNCRTITHAIDLNTIVEPDRYIIATTDITNGPFNWTGFLLDVKIYTYGWIVQEVHGLHNNPCHYYRIGNSPSNARQNGHPDLNVTWSDWQQNMTSTDVTARIQNAINAAFNKSDYIVANMGDSIFGNFQDETSVSSNIAEITGATVYNLGFGGCRMSTHYDPWNAFCMYSLADAIVSRDFSKQDAALGHGETPDYFAASLERLKALDFSTVDIVTIAYGVNDYTASKGLDNANNPYDTEYYAGALRYSLERLLTAYPNIRPVLVTPSWCYWPDTGEDSDTRYFNLEQDTLASFAQKVVEVAKEYHIPVVDAYNERAVNKFNCSYWFNSGDGIHPNAAGRKTLAKLISRTITGM